jgi:BASS family bile acid:Na+ symporter
MLVTNPLASSNPAAAPAAASQVGMQSSALAAVLAKIHFPQDPMIVAPCVLSACTHATLGSLLAGYWNATAKD